MSESEGFILKAEQFNQEEWCEMFIRVSETCKDLRVENECLQNQLQQKENIIKEVREYINNHFYMESTGGIQHPTFDGKMNRDTDGFEMLEILDKGK